MSIQINNTDLRIRPSSVDTFFGCAYQWGKVYLEGMTTIPSARASVGTSVHRGAEVFWSERNGLTEAQAKAVATSAALEQWSEEQQLGLQFNNGEDNKSCAAEVMAGTETWVDDIAKYLPAPELVEKTLVVPIANNPLVAEVGGTLDYFGDNTLSDIKTSKRMPTPQNYVVQQSLYKFLAEKHELDVEVMSIQAVVFKKNETVGAILPLEPNVPQAKSLVNSMLDTMDLIAKDVVPIDTVLRGNPKYMFCSPKYCNLYNECKFVKGDA